MTAQDAIDRVREAGVPWGKILAVAPLAVALIAWAVQAEVRTRANAAALVAAQDNAAQQDARLRIVEARVAASEAQFSELFRAVERIEGDVRQTTELQREILQKLSASRP